MLTGDHIVIEVISQSVWVELTKDSFRLKDIGRFAINKAVGCIETGQSREMLAAGTVHSAN